MIVFPELRILLTRRGTQSQAAIAAWQQELYRRAYIFVRASTRDAQFRRRIVFADRDVVARN